jgi:excisionase family DNA binding protein
MKRKLGAQDTNRRVTGAPRFFTMGDIAASMKVSKRTVRRWVASGALPVHRFDGVVRIDERDHLAFLAVHKEG